MAIKVLKSMTESAEIEEFKKEFMIMRYASWEGRREAKRGRRRER